MTDRIEKSRYDALMHDNDGRAFEQKVAGYFGQRGWPVVPRKTFAGCGEFDLYAKIPNTFSPDQYLLVECKDTVRVHAADITRFQSKVEIFSGRHKEASIESWFCYTGEINLEAKKVAESHTLPINFKRF